ncbi:MAG: SgcJ/EcaC family oxidoreductase [Rhodothermales bacterium]|nr:SgcJ/EcaC family oxidoreductase [Rhodothermales bacterium]
MNDVLRAIEKRRGDWIAAVNSRDVEAYLKVLAPDIVWLPPGQAVVEGRSAFAAWVRPFFRSYRYDFTIADAVVKVSGDFAVERGRFETELSSVDTGDVMTHRGSYLALWRHTDEAGWLIERYLDGAYLGHLES